ncbi:MAG: response regulator [Candidatus Zixiibacteriota bacterium]|nr:MAG: response regulator [candidate division Zixibacteria bacterium]
MSEPDIKTILVVDDEADVRNYLSMALTDAGFNVITASDGFDALKQVKKHNPDLISLDLVMPKRSGIKFYRDMVKNKEWEKIPIIIVTGHARDDLGKSDLKELTMSGPGIYLEKPIKPNNYVGAIKQLLEMDTTEDEQEAAEQVELQNELKNIIDDANPETLKKLREMMNKKK